MLLKSTDIKVEKSFIEILNTDEGEWNYQPIISKKQNKNDNVYKLSLRFQVKNTDENPFPYNIDIIVSGLFEIEFEEKEKDEDIKKFLNVSAVQIVFPFLRSTISTSMSAAMLPPIILPVVDASKIFEEEN